MENVVLKATKRDVIGKQVKAMRREGKLPAVLYGHGFEPRPITLDMRNASRALFDLTSSSLIKIDLDGEMLNALVRDKQRDYLKNSFLHVDFLVVSMTEKIRAFVEIRLTGTAPAVRNFNGVADQVVNQIEVESLPGDLPESIIVDISGLETIGSRICVGDLPIPSGVTVLTDKDEIIVSVTSAVAEVAAEEGAEVSASEPEVIEKGKKEEEEE